MVFPGPTVTSSSQFLPARLSTMNGCGGGLSSTFLNGVSPQSSNTEHTHILSNTETGSGQVAGYQAFTK